MDLPPPDFEGKPLPKPAPPPEPVLEPSPPAQGHTPRPDEPPPLLGPKKVAPTESMVDLDPDSIISLLKDALTYPWRKDGWMILIPGAIIAIVFAIPPFAGLKMSSFAGLVGFAAVALGCCYFAAYYFDIIETTLTGRDNPPEWPAISDLLDDVFRPALRMLGVALLSMAPLIWMMFSGAADVMDDSMGFRELIGFCLYWMYLPMATLSVVYHGTFSAAFPHRVIPAIAKCMPGYLLGVGALAGGEALQELLTVPFSAIPYIGLAIPFLIYFYSLVVQARLTGTLYLRYQDRIGW